MFPANSPLRALVFARPVVLLLAVALPGSAGAQLSPVGPERPVNDFTPDFQQQAAVAADGAGDFVVVWSSSFEPARLGDCCQTIQARRFDADGTPIGGQFQVSSGTTNFQLDPAIAADVGGGFVVAWTSGGSNGTDSDFLSVQAQRFDAAGSPSGDRFQVNGFTTDGQYTPAIAADSTGGFVVAWNSEGSSGDDDSGTSIQARLFGADGSPLAAEFQVNDFTPGAQHLPAVARRADGDFVVAWLSYGSPGGDSDWSIQARLFEANGAPLGGQFQVNALTTGTQFRPAVAWGTGGGFVVVWDSEVSSGGDGSPSIQARAFAADGTPAGAELQVNSYGTGAQRRAGVAPVADGGWLVTWESDGSPAGDQSSESIQARRIDAGAMPRGAQFQLNTHTPSAQRAARVAVGPGGAALAVWESLGPPDGSASDLLGQALAVAFFFDDFESGDTNRWSAVGP